MYFLVFILLFMSLFVLMLFNKPAIIFFEFDTNQDDLYLLFYWLYPLLKFRVQIINYTPFLFIYLFRIRIYSKAIKAKTEKKQITVEDYHALVLNSTYAKLYYGLSNPSLTGIVNGIIIIIQSCFNDIFIAQIPDFIPDKEYIVIKAGTELNIGKTIVRIIRIKLVSKKIQRRKQYGAISVSAESNPSIIIFYKPYQTFI